MGVYWWGKINNVDRLVKIMRNVLDQWSEGIEKWQNVGVKELFSCLTRIVPGIRGGVCNWKLERMIWKSLMEFGQEQHHRS